jgi:MFS family permease
MMNVAISAIVIDLETTVQGVQSAIALYATVMAAFTLAAGKLGDLWGLKRVFVIGIGAYAIGTLTAAFTPNLAILTLGWSIIEGVGAALILPATLTMLTLKYTGTQRAFGFGVIGGVQAFGAAVGPIFGGFMASQFSWRWAFGSEAVIVAIIVLLLPVLPATPPPGRDSDPPITLDYGGIALSASGLALLTLSMIAAGQYGWWVARRPLSLGSWEIAPFGLSVVPFGLAIAIALLIAFYFWQKRRDRHRKTPLLRPDLFQNRRFVRGATAATLLNLIMAGMLFTLPVFLQGALGFSPLDSGIALLPLSIAVLVLSLSSAGLNRRINPKWLMLTGLGIMFAGCGVLQGAIALDVTRAQLAPGLALFGIGTGLILAQITNVTLSAVESTASGEASAANNAVRQLGTSLGTALIGAVLMGLLFLGIVQGTVAELGDGQPLDRATRRAAVVALQDLAAGMQPAQQPPLPFEVSPALIAELDQVIDQSWIQAERGALVAIAVAVVGCAIMVAIL